ncbi:MAG: serine/threonine-protein kinase [Gemmatimonadota bacterium]|nr:serine/threonine-protein kinase [Gemmatimonadota bacterium]
MTGPVARLTSALADRYRLDREVGQGGMATVYLAEDLKHGRKVAIKVLHPELSAVLGGERFLAEIKVTANLQHPHILGLIDSGEADGLLYYVMPYVAGESLRARLMREKQLPVDEAIRLAREVASALDYAHRQGVVHRDIKPENTLLHDGAALVADFGIALAVQQAGGSRMTQTGMSLGTPAYMSPEQAMGDREIGARSDVYALGAMTYEMLAGEPPFTGPSSQAIVAKVLTEQPPPLRPKRPTVPPSAEAAILTALQKLPADRWGTAKEFSDALGGPGQHHAPSAPTVPLRAAVAGASGRARSAALWLGWAVAGVATALAGWALLRPRPQLPPSRLAILAPGLGGSGASSSQRHLTFLPDGDGLVYSIVGAEGTLRLVRQSLEDDAPTPIPGAFSMSSPAISPDGRWLVGTLGVRSQILRLPMEGGAPELVIPTLTTSDEAAWAPDGTLWLTHPSGGLAQVVGDSLVMRVPGNQHRLQQILPDGRTALVVRSRVGNLTGPVLVVDLESGAETPLFGTPVVEARVTSGFLVFVGQGGNLQAAPIDRDGRRITGPAVTVATNVAVTGTGVAQFAVAPNGNVAYIPEEPASLVFMDRAGASRLATAERRNFHHPMFSPDARRLSLDFNSIEGRNVWILGLAEGTLSRATFDRDGHDATWTPDGRSITYIAPRVRPEGLTLVLLRKPPGSAEPPDTLLASGSLSYTGVWLRDGSGVVTTGVNLRRDPGRPDSVQRDTRTDAGIIRNGGRGPIEPLVASPFAEQYVSPSPDGRWIVFVSDQSGRDEVYVRDLAGRGDQVLVSLEGGSEPVWGPDGRELFYRETKPADPYLIAAGIATTPDLVVTGRKRLFPIGDIVGTAPHANYDLSPDGKTFVAVRRSPAARIMVIQNLPALVRRLQGERRGRE